MYVYMYMRISSPTPEGPPGPHQRTPGALLGPFWVLLGVRCRWRAKPEAASPEDVSYRAVASVTDDDKIKIQLKTATPWK